MSVQKELQHNISCQFTAYGQLSPNFVSSEVRQRCPVSPFLFDYFIEDVVQNALAGFLHDGVEFLPGNRPIELEYTDGIVSMNKMHRQCYAR